jgi:hypothetical protein
MTANAMNGLSLRRSDMPAMPRPDAKDMRKGTQIAFKILGIPANMRKPKETKKDRYIDSRLLQEETVRVR